MPTMRHTDCQAQVEHQLAVAGAIVVQKCLEGQTDDSLQGLIDSTSGWDDDVQGWLCCLEVFYGMSVDHKDPAILGRPSPQEKARFHPGLVLLGKGCR